ncbi:hypothetical protein SDJN02_04824, partial [Cucurbita argyrosperma subsp. argyrosperma]
MSGCKNDEPLFCNVRSLAFCLVTESRNSMLKWKEKNLQATRTEPEFCFHSSCSYTSTLVADMKILSILSQVAVKMVIRGIPS